MRTTTAGLVLAAGTLTVLGGIAQGKGINPRPIIATGALGVAMLGIEQARPDLARGLAGIIFVTACLVSGVPVAEGIARAVGASSTTTPERTPTP